MVVIVNLTPHTINLCGKEIVSSGAARCQTLEREIAVIDGIRVNQRTFGEVYGLPEPKADTIYIVSAIVAQALAGSREDVFVVDETVRDENGKICGCKALARVGG